MAEARAKRVRLFFHPQDAVIAGAVLAGGASDGLLRLLR